MAEVARAVTNTNYLKLDSSGRFRRYPNRAGRLDDNGAPLIDRPPTRDDAKGRVGELPATPCRRVDARFATIHPEIEAKDPSDQEARRHHREVQPALFWAFSVMCRGQQT